MKIFKRKIRCFQVFKDTINMIGKIEFPINKEVSKDTIWHLFNWTCWKRCKDSYELGLRYGVKSDGIKIYPNKFSYGICNSDIIFRLNGDYIVAEPVGFSKHKTFKDAVNSIRSRRW